jgi:hypothetical protein
VPLTEIEQEFDLPLPVDRAIAFFTPRGEEAWVPGWRPHYAWPETGETRREMLFTTGADAATVIWTCLAWEPDLGHARYLKVMPPALAVFVDVRAEPAAQDCSRVTVAYAYAPLTPEGEQTVAAIDRDAQRAALAHWPRLLEGAGLLPQRPAEPCRLP